VGDAQLVLPSTTRHGLAGPIEAAPRGRAHVRARNLLQRDWPAQQAMCVRDVCGGHARACDAARYIGGICFGTGFRDFAAF
jgi:hypothetical protein